ncbi:LytTR family transcriptional regulator DNA-binding domain-containing protein [Halobacillus sp. GSS1]|uniref:LytTR family DNA-binding domain-containing protein n=1 Tax=Halobacillus sp. GSS1 TaxID=2815919 RepID=UPI001A8E0328|nr:LytTR family DNA-binding domain-containing protein [Halobacillus sp. GSS1]MBN9654006.1 LytTR family transcriptional regulator DNA-binding domain-containing protein [Halobacillus sp. GSS1]
MKLIVDINDTYEETKVTVECKRVDPSIRKILDVLEEEKHDLVIGYKEDRQHLLKPRDVEYFYTEKETVYASHTKGKYRIREKLYELHESLPSDQFIRLSKSTIANLYKISHFEPSFHGTLVVHFQSGSKEYASRHYVKEIKNTLKMNRRKEK